MAIGFADLTGTNFNNCVKKIGQVIKKDAKKGKKSLRPNKIPTIESIKTMMFDSENEIVELTKHMAEKNRAKVNKILLSFLISIAHFF